MAYSMNVPIEGNTVQFDIEFGFESVYTGEYEVGSSLVEQTLPTANKQMLRDIVIDPLPVSKMSNPHNGYTVKIG